jgi:hypothetical protein
VTVENEDRSSREGDQARSVDIALLCLEAATTPAELRAEREFARRAGTNYYMHEYLCHMKMSIFPCVYMSINEYSICIYMHTIPVELRAEREFARRAGTFHVYSIYKKKYLYLHMYMYAYLTMTERH